MLPYLQPPHVQLGFYWHDVSDVDAYRRLLRWLVCQGYEISPQVLAIRAEAGRLPRFSHLALLCMGGPDTETRRFDDWDIKRALTATDWLPVEIRLLPKHAENVEADLTYGKASEGVLPTPDPHVIEIVASAHDMELVQYPDTITPGSQITESARKTKTWCDATFMAVCDELGPDYAKHDWEESLEPPGPLMDSIYDTDYWHLYLSEERFGPAREIETAGALASWRRQRFAHGLYLQPGQEGRRDMEEPGIAFLRELFRKAFRG
ncbi:MAG: hypothetical protein JXQ73_25545 [Phycisphaerae bacterium]|nr:hypothetical protein [Phycisphaerae bacterium]